jgi:hypothetical protein
MEGTEQVKRYGPPRPDPLPGGEGAMSFYLLLFLYLS